MLSYLEEEDVPKGPTPVDVGIELMIEGKYREAFIHFDDAVKDFEPSDAELRGYTLSQLRYGRAISRLVVAVKRLSKFITSLVGGAEELKNPSLQQRRFELFYEPESYYSLLDSSRLHGKKQMIGMNKLIDSLLKSFIISPLEDASEDLEYVLDDENFVFPITKLKLTFSLGGDEQEVVFVGHHKRVVVIAILDMIYVILAVTYTLNSWDWGIGIAPYLTALNYIEANGGFLAAYERFYTKLTPLLVYFLNEIDGFLMGDEKSAEDVKNVIKKYAFLPSAWYFLAVDGYDPEKDLVYVKDDRIYLKVEEGGILNPVELFKMSEGIRVSYFEKKEKYGSWALAMQKSLTEGKPVSCGIVLFPLFELLKFAISSGAVKFVLGEVGRGVEEIGEKFDYDAVLSRIQDLLDGISDFMLWCEKVLFFDLSKLADGLIRLRENLPIWTGYGGKFFDNFIVEFECGTTYPVGPTRYMSEDGDSCEEGAPLEDMRHFERPYKLGKGIKEVLGYPVDDGINPLRGKGIPKDGLKSRGAYVLWNSPSFGGFIYLNSEYIPGIRSGDPPCEFDMKTAHIVEVDGKILYKPEKEVGVCIWGLMVKILDRIIQ